MDVVLIRHGLAEPLQRTDFERPLTPEGRAVTSKIAENLSDYLPKPTWVLDSGLKRAAETAEIFHRVLGSGERKVLTTLMPGGDSVALGKDLQKYATTDVIYLVGHNPDIGLHASYLLTGQALGFAHFKKAAVMWIEFQVGNLPGQGNLKCYLPPALSKFVKLKK